MTVADSWERILTWCAEHAPESLSSIRPAAPESERRAAEQATGVRWPDDLRAWYALADGTEIQPRGTLLPFYRPLPLREVVSRWQMLQSVWADIYPPDVLETGRQGPAGTVAAAFLADYVPIAEDGTGDTMYVDTRPGDQTGCVGIFFHADTDTYGPVWDSITAMRADVADSVEQNRPCNGWLPTVTDRRLDWSVADPRWAR